LTWVKPATSIFTNQLESEFASLITEMVYAWQIMFQ